MKLRRYCGKYTHKEAEEAINEHTARCVTACRTLHAAIINKYKFDNDVEYGGQEINQALDQYKELLRHSIIQSKNQVFGK